MAIVVPAYRVAPQLGRVLSGIPPWVRHVIVVDDASDDASAEIARSCGDARVELVRRDHNGGVGAAMKLGYTRALALGAQIVVKMDGDDQMDPAQLGALIAPILRGQADYAKGNRFASRRAISAMPTARRLGNLALSFMAKLASGYWNVFDPTNGYTAIRREALEALDLDGVADRYFFEISMLVELNVTSAAVRDVFMPARYGDERSSMSLPKIALSFPFELTRAAVHRIWARYFVRDFSAVSLFLVTGVPLVLVGASLGAGYWARSIERGVPTTAGQVMLAAFPLIVGFMLLLQSLVLDVASVPQSSARGPISGNPGVGGADTSVESADA